MNQDLELLRHENGEDPPVAASNVVRNGIGHYDMLVQRREIAVRGLSPTAKHQAFPTVYAKPVPMPNPLKPLQAEVAWLKARVQRLERENERLRQKAIDDARMKSMEGERKAAASVDQVLTEYLKALKALGFQIHGHALTLEDLRCHRRSRVYIQPRHVAMWLCVRLTGMSLPKLGHALGGRDHTSIMHGRDKALAIMEASPLLKAAAMVVVGALGIDE